MHSYDALKKCIYQLEKQQHAHDHHYPDLESNEQSTLLEQTDGSETDALFIPLLDRELKKIVLFYEQQKNELMEDFNDLEKDVEFQETLGLQGGAHYEDYDDGDEDDDESISSPRSPEGVRRSLSRHGKTSSVGRQCMPSSALLVTLCYVSLMAVFSRP